MPREQDPGDLPLLQPKSPSPETPRARDTGTGLPRTRETPMAAEPPTACWPCCPAHEHSQEKNPMSHEFSTGAAKEESRAGSLRARGTLLWPSLGRPLPQGAGSTSSSLAPPSWLSHTRLSSGLPGSCPGNSQGGTSRSVRGPGTNAVLQTRGCRQQKFHSWGSLAKDEHIVRTQNTVLALRLGNGHDK